jgi:hypothetical protein
MSDILQGVINIIKSGMIVSAKKIKTLFPKKNTQPVRPEDKHHH